MTKKKTKEWNYQRDMNDLSNDIEHSIDDIFSGAKRLHGDIRTIRREVPKHYRKAKGFWKDFLS